MAMFSVKKLISAVLVTGIAVALVSLNIIAQGRETPVSQNAGRMVKLKKIAVTHDEKGNFIFKNPENIVSVEDGGFFLEDDGKILQFAADGGFVKTVIGKGQGPGEATYLNQLYKLENELIVNTGFMRKMMVFGFDGELRGEYKERKSRKFLKKGIGFSEVSYKILGHREDGSLLVLKPTILQNKKEKIKKDSVFLLSAKNEWQDKLFEIPMEYIIIDMGGGEKIMLGKLSLLHACDRQFLYFSNTERYEIKKYNIKNNKIEALLKRKYNPVPIPKELKDKFQYGGVFKSAGINKKTKVVKPPQPEHFHDIVRLFVVDGHVWVMTSTFDKEKGVLFDVYNLEGDYFDNFYLSFPGLSNLTKALDLKEIHIFKKYLFKKETDEEGNYMVLKYEIVDSKKKN